MGCLTAIPVTASKLLSQLERNFGATLIRRSTRASHPTKEGSDYYHEVCQLMARLSDLDASIKDNATIPKGRIRVDFHSAMANSILIPILGGFRSLYPEIQLVLGISDRPISLIEEAADCVIRLGRLPDASLIAKVLFEDRLITCASPAFCRARARRCHRRSWLNITNSLAPFQRSRGKPPHWYSGRAARSPSWNKPTSFPMTAQVCIQGGPP